MSETNLGAAYVQIVPSARGIKSAITKELDGEAGNAGTKAGKSIVSKLKGVLVAAGIGKILGDAISAGADLEQSIGGIETLYGTGGKSLKEYADSVGKTIREVIPEYNALQQSQATMLTYANDAYKTAGLSANDYMQQVTSFSASLLQGLGGDTNKAAEIANMAMIDMADNANKFGTDIGSVQAAIQGLAKGNYTMLDNLKLGFAGTQQGMVELINASGILDKEIKNLDGISFDQMLLAIHEVQGQLGITGTTSKEAASTFTGSLNMLKGSWQNVLAALTTGENLDGALAGLTESLMAFGSNAVRLLGNVFRQLPTLLVSVLTEMIPQIVPFAVEMVKSFGSAVVSNWPQIKESFGTMIRQLGDAVKSVDWVQLGKDIIRGIINGLGSMASALWNKMKEIVRGGLKAGQQEAQTGSPSRLFANELGRWIPAGIALGVDQNAYTVNSAVRDAIAGATRQPLPSPMARSTGGSDADRIIAALQGLRLVTEVELSGDARKIFRVVRTENTTQTRRTNYNALAAAGV